MNVDNDKQARRGQWPFPGDAPVARARRIAHMYRAQLRALDTTACDRLDDTARSFGETWVVPRLVTHQDDDLLPPADAADFLCINTESLGDLRRRGRLIGHLVNGVWNYRVADLRKLTETRPRG